MTPSAVAAYAGSIDQVVRKHDVLLYGAMDEPMSSSIYAETETDLADIPTNIITMEGMLDEI